MSISSSQTCFKEERFSCPLSRFNRRCKKLAACLPPNGSFAKAVAPSHFPPDWRSRILLSHAAWMYFQLQKSPWHTALFCAGFVVYVCLYTRFVNQTCYWKAIQELMLPERISLRTQKYIVLEERFLKGVKTSDGLDTIKTSTCDCFFSITKEKALQCTELRPDGWGAGRVEQPHRVLGEQVS